MNINFDPTIKLSDILTSLSFLLAIFALIYNQRKDRANSKREQLADARAILSNGLSKLERWRELSGSTFDELQPKLVQATEIWAKDGNTISARDYLWREINSTFLSVDMKIRDDHISGAYIDIYRLSKDLAEKYRVVINKIKELSENNRNDVLKNTQRVVLSFEHFQGTRIAAQMGNKLRETVEKDRIAFFDSVNRLTKPLYDLIIISLSKNDNDLLCELDSKN